MFATPFIRQVLALSLVTSFITSNCLIQADDESSDDSKPLTLIPVQNRSVKNIVSVVGDLAIDESIRIVPDFESNILIASGTKEGVRRLAEMVKHLDQPHQTLNLDIEITVSNPDSDSDTPTFADRLQLSALEDNKAVVQIGQQIAVTEGITTGRGSSGPPDFRRVSTRMEQVGTLVQAVGRVAGNKTVVELQIEKSWYEPAPKTDDGVAFGSQFNATTQTTLELESGQTQTITAKATGTTDQTRLVTINVTLTTGSRTASGDRNARAASGPTRSGQSGRSGFRGSPEGRSQFGGGGAFGRGGGNPPGRGSGGFPGGFGGFGSGNRPGADRSGDRDASSFPGSRTPSEMIPRFAEALDRDRDGTISVEEWQASRRIKADFEEAGIDATDMTKEEFIENFRKVFPREQD